jgi:hypothetical protein
MKKNGVTMNCPRCGSEYVSRQRKKRGFTECSSCELTLENDVWDRLKHKIKRLGSKGFIKLKTPELSQEEAIVVARRREEMWSRLNRFGDKLADPKTIKQVKNTILQYIAELEARKEIPVGLTVVSIGENKQRLGSLIVQFGLTDDCPKENREPLLGFLTGRLSLL